MKRFLISILVLQAMLAASARFNTICRKPQLYRIEMLGDKETVSEPAKKKTKTPSRSERLTAANTNGFYPDYDDEDEYDDDDEDNEEEYEDEDENEEEEGDDETASREMPVDLTPSTEPLSYEQAVQRYLSVSYPLTNITVTSPFGTRRDPIHGGKGIHTGLDLRASYEPVSAMMHGVVKRTGQDGRSGKFVMLEHGDYTVSYCHLSQILVEKGQYVKPGEHVGITGNTGRSTGPHLHITLKRKGAPVDPALFLEGIRLVKKSVIDQLANSTD